MEFPEFTAFPKMARLSRNVIVTEKIDGTNAQIMITEDGDFFTGSRTRWITPEDDNFGFSRWAHANKDELMKLGPGRHFGEWWGSKIQRGYGLANGKKTFSLFNASRWCEAGGVPRQIPSADIRVIKFQDEAPECCRVVPVLYEGQFSIDECEFALEKLRKLGSVAAPGFMRPEGIVCYHIAGGVGFKKTIEKDDQPKGPQ